MFIDLIRKRRSIRKYTEKQVEGDKIELLVEAALRAPSSMGKNPWEFVCVTDKDLLNRLSKAKKHGSSFLFRAPCGIVVCADPTISDVWVEDASIAAIFIQLAAESMGLGSCWIQIRERSHSASISAEGYVRKILNIPPRLKIECIIALGYPDEEKSPHKQDELQHDKVYRDTYR